MDEDSSCSSAITGQPLLVRGQGASGLANTQQASGCYMLPMEFSTTSEQSVVRLLQHVLSAPSEHTGHAAGASAVLFQQIGMLLKMTAVRLG